MGGMNSGPRTMGASGTGSGSGRDPAPKVGGPIPRRMEARPIVAMTTAMTGRPMSWRSMTRSSPNPKATMVARPSVTDTHRGAFEMSSAAATRMPEIITNSPCAKFTASVALYTSTKPSAMRAYMSPMRSPLDRRSSRKPSSSDTGGCSFHVFDVDTRLDRRLPAVLVRDGRGQLDLVLAAVQRLDHRRVLVGDEAAADLAGSRHLGVVRVQVLGQQEEATELRGVRQGLVALPDLLADELADLRLLRQVHVRRVRQAAALRPVPHRAQVDRHHGGHERSVVAEGDGLPDERAELELVLDELRRERCTVGERSHVLRAVDDDEVALRVDEAGVTRVKPPIVIDDLAGRLVVLEIPLEHRAAAHEDLAAALGNLDLDARHRTPGGGGIGLGVGLERHQTGGLRGAVDLLEVDPDRAEEPEGVR